MVSSAGEETELKESDTLLSAIDEAREEAVSYITDYQELDEQNAILLEIVKSAQSVLSETGVREFLCAYVMGADMIDRIDDWHSSQAKP